MHFIDLQAQQQQRLSDGRTLREAVDSRISAVLNHGQYILGPEVAELEKRLSSYVGVEHCVAVASGTDALLIALMALGVQRGDEVITSPFSYIATAESIALLGAVPVYVDINPHTYNLNPDQLESEITTRTKAIIPVSLYGQPADFRSINSIADRYGIPVIEDAAQSFGASHYGHRSCGLSTIGITSFFPSKPLGCYGDGGACFTSDEQLADRMRRISRHGQSRRYFHTEIGINGRIDTLQAAIILAKLELFDSEVNLRCHLGSELSERLHYAGINSTPKLDPCNTSVYAQFTIRVNNRQAVQAALREKGIPTAVHYPTLLCHQPALADFSANRKSDFDIALLASQQVLSLPFHPYLTQSGVSKIVDAVVSAANI